MPFDPFSIFSSSSGEDAANAATGAITKAATQGGTKYRGAIQGGQKRTIADYRKALTDLNAIYGTETQGRNAYMDALGLNGPEGTARARAAFTASPGYNYNVQQGTQAIDRNRAAMGGLNAGGTNTDLATYIHGLANNDYTQNYLTPLSGFNPLASAQSRANVLTGMGDVYGHNAENIGQSWQNQYNTIGQAQAQGIQNQYGAQQGAANNFWNLLGNGLSLGTKAIGMFG